MRKKGGVLTKDRFRRGNVFTEKDLDIFQVPRIPLKEPPAVVVDRMNYVISQASMRGAIEDSLPQRSKITRPMKAATSWLNRTIAATAGIPDDLPVMGDVPRETANFRNFFADKLQLLDAQAECRMNS